MVGGASGMELSTLIIAILSIVIASITAGWTIYRDAIRKPKFRVSISKKIIQQVGLDPIGPDIYLEALNLGPLPNRLGCTFCRVGWWRRRFYRKENSAFLYSDHAHPAATASGKRIDVGDTGMIVFPYNNDCFPL